MNGQQASCPTEMMLGQDISPEALQPGPPAAPAPHLPASKVSILIVDATGFDLRPNPLKANTPADLAAALREYRIWAGRPSFRELARRTGGTPAASTICTMLRSKELPSFDCMLAYVSACGATDEDRQRFATAWRRLSLRGHDDKAGTQLIPAPRDAAERLPGRQDR